MNREDFSNSFDTLANSYATIASFGNTANPSEFDEYEKSLFLTKAQEEVALSLYSGLNPEGDSFEKNEKLRRYFANIIKEDTKTPETNSGGIPLGGDTNHFFFTLPEDLWFITYECVTVDSPKCGSNHVIDVFPVRQDEYSKIRKNPFRGANERRALRMDLAENVVEIISKYTVSKYYVRYLKKLNPIILIDLPDGMTINGEYTASDFDAPCELHESLHQRILDRAVRMALQSKGYRINENN